MVLTDPCVLRFQFDGGVRRSGVVGARVRGCGGGGLRRRWGRVVPSSPVQPRGASAVKRSVPPGGEYPVVPGGGGGGSVVVPRVVVMVVVMLGVHQAP